MQPVMNVADVLEFEAALGEKGLKPAELMRRAGAVVALQAARLVDEGSVVVLCGMGNNGGDGWVAADNLARHGYEVSVVAAATPAVIKSEVARKAAARASEMGIPVHVDPGYDELAGLLAQADVVVDAVFGTGFKGSLPAPYDMWVRAVDEEFRGMVVAVDVPSGISAATGMSAGPHFEADVTVTMFAMKPGLISGEGRTASGTVVVASLADGDEGLTDLSDAAAAFTLEDADYNGVLPEPDPLQDKYTRGRVLVVAGSARYPGAAVMAAVAAARAGAGYVTLAVPASVVPVVQTHLLSIPVVGLPADEEGSFAPEAADRAAALAAKADVVLAGPGATTSFGACEVVRRLLAEPCALVLDADALNALVKVCTGSATEHPDALRRDRPLVLTPHRRELARLVGADTPATASLAGAMSAAQNLAWSVGSADFCVIAKGPMTAVSTIDSTLIPEPGPAALATAGTGDVLSGVVASLLAQTLAQRGPEEGIGSSDLLMLMAAADRVHALAGYLAVEAYGSRGIMATDVAEKVGLAVDELLDAAERAAEEAGEDAGSELEGGLAFEDESRITPPPEVERLIRSDAAAREARLPGEIKAPAATKVVAASKLASEIAMSDLELEEPAGQVGAPEAAEPAEAAGAARDEGTDGLASESDGTGEQGDPAPAPTPASAEAPASPVAPEASRTTQMPAVRAEAAAPAADGDAAGGQEPGPANAASVPAPVGAPAPASPVAPAAPAPEAGPVTGAPAVPPFLANAAVPMLRHRRAAEKGAGDGTVEKRVPVRAAADETTVIPAVRPAPEQAPAEPGAARGPEPQAEPVPEPEPEPEPKRRVRRLTPQEIEARRLAAFHERATMHIDGDSVTPVDERPSAKARRRKEPPRR